MQDEQVDGNLKGMDNLDFDGWNTGQSPGRGHIHPRHHPDHRRQPNAGLAGT
jgi:hypothetical protein